ALRDEGLELALDSGNITGHGATRISGRLEGCFGRVPLWVPLRRRTDRRPPLHCWVGLSCSLASGCISDVLPPTGPSVLPTSGGDGRPSRWGWRSSRRTSAHGLKGFGKRRAGPPGSSGTQAS